MLVTEDQARGALCPHSGFTMPCMGSACLMGWRWLNNTQVEIQVTTKNEPPPGDGWQPRGKVGARWSWQRPWNAERKGYCGPSGKPEPSYNTDKVPCERED